MISGCPPHIIRIAGSSFSGSTALGHFLNTAPGFLFGSELYKLLPAFTNAFAPARVTPCDHCGSDCTVWTETLRARLQQHPDSTLADVYDLFFESQPGHRVLVDGSKLKRWFVLGAQPRQSLSYVVAVKHPFRLLASFVNNDKNWIPADQRQTLERGAAYLDAEGERSLSRMGQLVDRLHVQYAELLDLVSGEEHRICRTDLREDVDSLLSNLAARHQTSFAPERMAELPCHALGDNRSVRWQVHAYRQGPGQPDRDLARFDYYRQQPRDYFVRDDKYLQLFSPALRQGIAQLPGVAALARLLGYTQAEPD